MTWQVLGGESAARRREALKKAGQPIPKELFPPQLLPGAQEWLDAFWEIHTDREFMANGPIPAGSLDRWLAMGRVTDFEFPHFRRAMRSMDDAYRAASDEKRENPTKKVSDKPLTKDAFKGMFG